MRFSFVLAFVLSIFSTTATAQWFGQKDPEKAVIVVMDDTGVAGVDGTPHKKIVMGRQLLLSKLNRDFDDSYMVTFISLWKQVPVWDGQAGTLLDAGQTEFEDFLLTEGAGCADFTRLTETLKDQIYFSSYPVEQIIFFSPMFDTGAYPCAEVTDYTKPEDEFFKWVYDTYSEGVSFSFYWLYKDALANLRSWARKNEMRERFRMESPNQSLVSFRK